MADARNQPDHDAVNYAWRHWTSDDGLKLAARDYPGRDDRPAIVCLPGLTRNSRDAAMLAGRLAGEWRVIAPDFRGRGKSEYAKDPMSYVPVTYAADVVAMLDAFDIGRIVAVGTSLGGLVKMALAALLPGRIVGAVLNDVGPELDPSGIGRIRNHVGKGQAMPTWLHAARALAEGQGSAHPDYAIEDWLAMAKRLYRLNSAGRIVPDYDMKIAEPFRVPSDEPPVDPWRLFAALDDMPLVVVRGALSDVLPVAVAVRMTARCDATLVTVPRTGHAPTLTEPVAVAAIDTLLSGIARDGVEPAAV